jgi:hypothetical protein
VAGAVRDLGHGFDAEDAFEGEVGLVSGTGVVSERLTTMKQDCCLRKRAGKVVC